MPVVSPVLVGRDAEAAALRSAYEQPRSGQGVTVLVSGEAGIGKTRLVTSVVADLPGTPLVLTGGCLESGTDSAPYVPFVAVVRSMVRQLGLDRVREHLPAHGSTLGSLLAELGPPPAHYVRTRLLEEVASLISRVAADRPVVLVVEDLHWADASSRELFAYLARNLVDSPVLLIGTVRTVAHPGRQLFAELGRGAHVTQLSLTPLDPAQVAYLLTMIDGRLPDPARCREIHRRSGGNPLFVETLSDVGAGSAGDLKALLLHRLDGLAPPARELLSASAVAGARTGDEVLREVSGLSDDDFRAAVTELTGHALIVLDDDAYLIRHDLIREAVYGQLLPADRRRWHARCAQALAEHDPGDFALAGHWRAGGHHEQALRTAWDAAGRAGRQHAYDEQLHLLGVVLDLFQPGVIDADLTTVREHAAAAAFAAGASDAATALSTLALTTIDEYAEPERAARMLWLRGHAANLAGTSGWDDLHHAALLVPPGRDDALRSRILSAQAFVGLGMYRLDESRTAATEAHAIAERLDDNDVRAPALLVLALLDGYEGDLIAGARRFEQARTLARTVGDQHTYLTSYQWQSLMMGAAGHYRQAVDLAMSGLAAAARLGRTRSRGSMLAAAAAIALRDLGRWDEADTLIDDALAENPPPLYRAALQNVAADIARRRGATIRFDTLLGRLTEFAAATDGADEVKVGIATLRAAYALDRDDPQTADALLTPVIPAQPPRWATPDVMQLAITAARTQRALRTRFPRNADIAEQTDARLALLARMVDEVPADTPAAAAFRLTFTAVTTQRLTAWDQAAEAWRALDNAYETAVALTDAAATALASNNRPGALARLRQAQQIATELGAVPLLSYIDELRTRGRLDDQRRPPRRADFGLTPREYAVLQVLADGSSNAQIAAQLFISTNTVATHVARILTKLDAATRTEAAAIAARAGLVNVTGPDEPGAP